MASHLQTLLPPQTLCTCAVAQNPKGSAHTYSTQTRSGFVLVIFPLRLARSGPTNWLALSTYCVVTGQLVNSCSRIIPANSLLVGFAIIP